MNPAIESLQAIGIDIWLPFTPKVPQYGLMSGLKTQDCLVLISEEDEQNWPKLEALLSNILKWQKIDPAAYCLGFLAHAENTKAYSLQELIAQVQPKKLISFGVSVRLELDSLPQIRYVETLRLIDILDNVENKRRVMNDFAGCTL